MGHCVGSYDLDLRDGTVILSLRDPENRPHCTMELIKRNIYQIKGKQNLPPVAKYRPYIRQFIALRRFKVVDDVDNAGMLLYANGRPCRDVNEYVRFLAAHGGLDPWDRRRDYPFDNWVTLGPLQPIASLADEMDDDTRELLFRTLARGFDAGIRFTPAAALNAFGTPFHYVFADYPFALYYLRNKGVFPGTAYGQRINLIIDRAVGQLLAKAAERPDWLFGVKMREYDGAGDDPWNCDILTASRMDFSQIRHCRHMMLRRRIAEIRRDVRPLMRDPTVSAALRDRWHRDWLEIQRVLDSRAGEFL